MEVKIRNENEKNSCFFSFNVTLFLLLVCVGFFWNSNWNASTSISLYNHFNNGCWYNRPVIQMGLNFKGLIFNPIFFILKLQKVLIKLKNLY